MATEFGPYSTLTGVLPNVPGYVPPSARSRVQSYIRYEEMYWNDARQYALRVLEGEEPVYIPNARTIVDITSHYLLKGLTVTTKDPKTQEALKALLDREKFFSRFHAAKHVGVTRGDYVLHITGNPNKAEGSRLSINSVNPSKVIPTWHPDIPDKMVKVDLVDWAANEDDSEGPPWVRRLHYELEESETGERRILRYEALYENGVDWWEPGAQIRKYVIPVGYLDEGITALPIYWFRNHTWEGWDFGSSELKGVERLLETVSQGSTDVQGSLSLEGLGVYATDGGRPVDSFGRETDWEVSPGRVMEVPAGAYFRRVQGISSITPATDQINYLEEKMREASGLSDIAMGKVESQVAESGIALAIKFLPTEAKIEQRDRDGLGVLTQFFYDWRSWHRAFEHQDLTGEIQVEIGAKLPQNRTERMNELNNFLDRRIISKKFYRQEMTKLGYEFPDNIEAEIEAELQKEAELKAQAAPPGLQQNAVDAVTGKLPPPPGEGATLPNPGNRSNNRNRVNESAGTEA